MASRASLFDDSYFADSWSRSTFFSCKFHFDDVYVVAFR